MRLGMGGGGGMRLGMGGGGNEVGNGRGDGKSEEDIYGSIVACLNTKITIDTQK